MAEVQGASFDKAVPVFAVVPVLVKIFRFDVKDFEFDAFGRRFRKARAAVLTLAAINENFVASAAATVMVCSAVNDVLAVRTGDSKDFHSNITPLTS